MAIIRLGTWAKSDRNTIHPAINSSVTFPLFVQSVIVLLVKKRSSRYLEYSFLYLDSRFSKAKKTTPNIIFVNPGDKCDLDLFCFFSLACRPTSS